MTLQIVPCPRGDSVLHSSQKFEVKVLHFFRTYLPDTVGGIESVIYNLCRAGSEQGVRNTVLTLSRDRTASIVQLDGHEVHRMPSEFNIASVQFSIRALARFARLADEADVIHYHFPWPMGDVAHLATRARKPSVVTYHADIKRQPSLLRLYKPLRRAFLGNVDRIVTTSENYARTSEVLRRYNQKVVVIPIGIGADYLAKPTAENVAAWRARFPGPFFFFLGMFRHYKGLKTLIEAAVQTGYPVVLAGDGPEMPSVRAQLARAGLNGKQVHLLERVSDEDKMALLMLCHAVILPSDSRAEAFGVSLVEGSICGKPMITCEIGTGTSFVNVHEQTGFVVPPANASALASAMTALWENPERARKMGLHAKHRAQTVFSAHRMAQDYRTIYEKIVAPSPQAAKHSTLGTVES